MVHSFVEVIFKKNVKRVDTNKQSLEIFRVQKLQLFIRICYTSESFVKSVITHTLEKIIHGTYNISA